MNTGKLKKILKLVTIGLSFALIAGGIQLLLGGGFSVQGFILRIYLFFFALKIFFCELGAKFMLNLFPYMDTFFGKGFFLVFIGVLLVGFVGVGSFSGIIGLAFLICGFGFILLKLLGQEKATTESGSSGNKNKETLTQKATKELARNELKRVTEN